MMEIISKPLEPLKFRSGKAVGEAIAYDRNGIPLEDHLARIEEKLDRLLAAQGLRP